MIWLLLTRKYTPDGLRVHFWQTVVLLFFQVFFLLSFSLSLSSSFRSYCNAFWCSTWLHAPCLHHCRDLSRFSFFFLGLPSCISFFFAFFFYARTCTSALLCDSLDTCAHYHKHILYLQRFSHCSLVICHFFFSPARRGFTSFFFPFSSLFCFFFSLLCVFLFTLIEPFTCVCVCVSVCIICLRIYSRALGASKGSKTYFALFFCCCCCCSLVVLFAFLFLFLFFSLFDCVRVFFF